MPAQRRVAPSARIPREAKPRGRARRTTRVREPGAPAREALERQEAGGQSEEDRGELGRRDAIEHPVPHAVDRLGQRAEAERRDRAEVRQRLHACQDRPGGERGTRQGQGDAEQDRRPRAPEAARGLQELRRLLGERRARERVHVGVVDERHHERHAPARAEVREAGAGAEPAAEGGLERARVLEETQEDEADDVGRERERQDQRPLEHPPARELARHDEPRERRPEEEDPEADPGDQGHRIEEQLRQLGASEMRPDRPRGMGERPEHGEDREGNDGGGGEGRRGPGPRAPGPRADRPGDPGHSGHERPAASGTRRGRRASSRRPGTLPRWRR